MKTMTANQKRYAVAKVLEIAESKKVKVKTKQPNLTAHIHRAAIDGTLKVRPGKELVAEAKEKVISSAGRYSDSPSFSFGEIFTKPAAYVAEVKARDAEAAKAEKANAKIDAAAEKVVDRINLDGFETGQQAIESMMQVAKAKI